MQENNGQELNSFNPYSPQVDQVEEVSEEEELIQRADPSISYGSIQEFIPENKRSDFETFLQSLGLSNTEDLAHEGIDLASLTRLWKVEFSFWHYIRWCYLDFVIERILHYPAIGTQDLRASSEISKKKDHRLWVGGRGLPLQPHASLWRNYAITGFKRGFELVLYEGTHSFIFGLLVFQLVQGIRFDRIHNIVEFLKNFFNGDEKVIVATLGVLQSPSARLTAAGILSLPIVGGIINAIVHASKSKAFLEAEWNKLDQYFAHELPKRHLWWHEYIKPLIPIVSLFNPIMPRLGKLELLLRWDGRLNPMMLRKTLGYLKQVAHNEAYFFSRIEALRVLARVAQGLSLRQFDLLQEDFGIENQLLRLALKTEALRVLHEISIQRQGYNLKTFSGTPKDKNIKSNTVYLYLKDPETLEYAVRNRDQQINRVILTQEDFEKHYESIIQKMKTCQKKFNSAQREALGRVFSAQGISFGKRGLKSLILSLCAHYYKWTLADSNAYSISVSMLIAKLIKTGLSFLIFKTFFSAIKEYLSCPGHPGVSIDGEELPWTANFSEKCLDTYMELFNLLPGQPASTLTDQLSHFKITGGYSLDLSNKNLNGTIVSEILQGFRKAKIHIKKLILKGNRINTVQNIEDLFSEIPKDILLLDFSENSLGDGLIDINAQPIFMDNLQKLSSLETLILSNNYISGDNPSIASVVESICSLNQTLKYLDLSENYLAINSENPDQYDLACLRNLETLLLSGNKGPSFFAKYDMTIIFINGFYVYQNLKELDFSGRLDVFADETIIAFIENISLLKNLIKLNLSQCSMRLSIYREKFFTNIISMNKLKILDLSFSLYKSYIFEDITQHDLEIILKTLSSSKSIQYFGAAPMQNITSDFVRSIRSLGVQTNLPIVNSMLDIDDYLKTIDPATKEINLSEKLINAEPMILDILLKEISRRCIIEHLDLSGNYEDCPNTQEGNAAIYSNLGLFPSIKSLNISRNWFSILPQDSLIAIQNFKNLTRLEKLDTGRGSFLDEDDCAIFSQIFPGFKNIKLISFSFGCNQTISIFSNSIGNLTTLEELRIYDLVSSESEENLPFFRALSKLTNLKKLTFSCSAIGAWSSIEPIILSESIQNMPLLQEISISNPDQCGGWWYHPDAFGIGSTDNLGIIALAESFVKLTHLSSINLLGNPIGIQGPEGPKALLKAFSKMPQLRTINVVDMTNVTWITEADNIQHITDAKLEEGCKGEICYGTPLEDQATIEASQKEEFFDCELDDCSDRYAMLRHQDQTRAVAVVEKKTLLKTEQVESENLLKKFLNSPCHFANWCVDQFIKGAVNVAHEAVEAGGPGYGKQQSVYEACSGVTMFNSTHVYHPQLEVPCPRVALSGR